MYKHILVAVDGSTTSTRGLKAAIALAKDAPAVINVIHVLDDIWTAATFTDGGYLPLEHIQAHAKERHDNGRKILDKADALVRKEGITVRTVLVEKMSKDLAHAIVQQARKCNADVIVLGTHGRRGLRRMLIGSDAEAVLRESHLPVLLVRYDDAAKPEQVAPTAKRRARGPKVTEAPKRIRAQRGSATNMI